MRRTRPPTGSAASSALAGSKYDLAGRVFQGVPAPYNLPVPPNHFPDDKTLRIGQNPPGQDFNFNSILQV
jgi:ubiquinol-cytochrome c reductase iron-sulfur subunit